jgi:cytochrome c-type biogenesis protein CcmH/NrfG
MAEYARLLGSEHDERGVEIARFAEERAAKEARGSFEDVMTELEIPGDPRSFDVAMWSSVARAYAANHDVEGALRAIRRQLDLRGPADRRTTQYVAGTAADLLPIRRSAPYRRFLCEAAEEWLDDMSTR